MSQQPRNFGDANARLAKSLPAGTPRRYVESWPPRMTPAEAASRFITLLDLRKIEESK
jgi:hypothetical protein